MKFGAHETNNSGTPRSAYQIGEAARSLGISEKTVRRLIARGLLVPSNSLRHVLIPVWSIVKFLESTSGGFASPEERRLHLSLLYEVLCHAPTRSKAFSIPDTSKSHEDSDSPPASAA